MTKTVTGLFDHYYHATSAVDQLKAAGISEDDISIVSNNADGRYKDSDVGEDAGTGAGIGAAVGGVGGLLTGLGIMAIPGVGPVVAAGWGSLPRLLAQSLVPLSAVLLAASSAR